MENPLQKGLLSLVFSMFSVLLLLWALYGSTALPEAKMAPFVLTTLSIATLLMVLSLYYAQGALTEQPKQPLAQASRIIAFSVLSAVILIMVIILIVLFLPSDSLSKSAEVTYSQPNVMSVESQSGQ